MRLWVGKFGPNDHCMIFTYHQVLFDRYSMQTFLAEVMKDYDSLIHGHLPSLSPTSFEPFVHYIADFQNDSKARAFWRHYLKGAPKSLCFPKSADCLIDQPLRMQNVKIQLTDIESRQIFERSREYSVTTNQFCQLAWAHTLSKLTGKKDIIFSTALTKKPANIPDIQQTVGVFSAHPPLRIIVKGKVSKALSQIAETYTERLKYGFLDLNEYNEEWVPTPGLGTLFLFNNQPEKESETSSSSLVSEQLGTVSGSNHQMVMSVTSGSEMTFSLLFDTTQISENVANEVTNEYLSSLLTLCHADSLDVGSLYSVDKVF
ncbi:MAG: hypothetical protein GY786_15285 [Proteobacteria bacterium]|nr:hypothetical protein [Pseudomonadota bacterium]